MSDAGMMLVMATLPYLTGPALADRQRHRSQYPAPFKIRFIHCVHLTLPAPVSRRNSTVEIGSKWLPATDAEKKCGAQVRDDRDTSHVNGGGKLFRKCLARPGVSWWFLPPAGRE